MTEFTNLRHYIFIDPTNLHGDIHVNSNFLTIKSALLSKYTTEVVKFYSYNDISALAKKYDTELYISFLNLNPAYPALLADIGRFLILYYYGGVYHDLKCYSTLQMAPFLNTMCEQKIQFIAETHPKETHRIRNTNIISLCVQHPYLKATLDTIKEKLKELQTTQCKGPQLVWDIGSGIYITLFNKFQTETTVRHLLEPEKITLDLNLYKKRSHAWQSTVDIIFSPSCSFLSILSKTKSIIDRDIVPIVKSTGEKLEGNIFMRDQTFEYTNNFLEKQLNFMVQLQKESVQSVLEIGFNSGFSTLLMLLTNPTVKITCIDICVHKYTIPCKDKLQELFPGRITFHKGSSPDILKQLHGSYDLIHIDGCHREDIAKLDIEYSIKLTKPGSVVIMDDVHGALLRNLWLKAVAEHKIQLVKDFIPSCYHAIGIMP